MLSKPSSTFNFFISDFNKVISDSKSRILSKVYEFVYCFSNKIDVDWRSWGFFFYVSVIFKPNS